jgi:hypothetical protein
MNTKANINNTGIKFAISNFKLEHGLYLTPDIRRVWTLARDAMAIAEEINPNSKPGSKFNRWAIEELPKYRFLFEEITMMHENDVYDALYIAAKRYHKVA